MLIVKAPGTKKKQKKQMKTYLTYIKNTNNCSNFRKDKTPVLKNEKLSILQNQ